MLYECHDYRSYLKQILIERIQKNPSYSLRALASQVGIAPGMLSEVFKNQKNISANKALEISNRLNHSASEEAYFIALVQLEHAKRPEQREKILEKIRSLNPKREIRDLTIDQFHTVANWICPASIALLGAHPKGLTCAEIADALSVHVYEAEEALDRWISLDHVEKTAEGRYVKLSEEHLRISSKPANSALRKFHRTMLEKAAMALEIQTNTEKIVGSETIGFDPRDLTEINHLIEDCVSKILAKAESGKKKTAVYHLGFQFFTLTHKPQKPQERKK